jgi:hypothetical protein
MKRTDTESDMVEAKGNSLSSLDQFWLDTARNMAKESLSTIEEASKQLIGIVALLQGLYLGIIVASDVRKILTGLQGTTYWLFLILLLVPLACWIVCLWLSALVFVPEIYRANLNSPELSQSFFLEIVAYKHKRLHYAYTALATGFLPLLFAILVYLIV